MNQMRIDEIRARCEAATPGPWRILSAGDDRIIVSRDNTLAITCTRNQERNADIIAHARQDIPDLLAALEEAEKDHRISRELLVFATARETELADRANELLRDRNRLTARVEALEADIDQRQKYQQLCDSNTLKTLEIANEEIAQLEAELDRYRQAEVSAKPRKSKYVFCQEVAAIAPNQDGELVFDDPECEPESVCVIRCASCGWHMYGDGWWGGDNFMKSEQIPRFCGHCGKEFDTEAALKEATHDKA